MTLLELITELEKNYHVSICLNEIDGKVESAYISQK